MAFVTLTRSDIERLLPMSACIEVMAEALTALERGDLSQPLRGRFAPAGRVIKRFGLVNTESPTAASRAAPGSAE